MSLTDLLWRDHELLLLERRTFSLIVNLLFIIDGVVWTFSFFWFAE